MITHDLRYGWRQLVQRPGTTVIAIMTLALGIGANVTMFSWAQTSLQRQMRAVPEADRYVAINQTTRTRNDLSLSYPDFADLRDHRPDSVEDLVAFTLAPMNLRTASEPERVWAELVSGNYFDVLGVSIPLGRGFRPEEDRVPNQHPVVVLSSHFWKRRFGGAPDVVGRTVTLNGRAFTVIGVAGKDFRGTEPYLNLDLWVPLMMQQVVLGGTDRLSLRGNHWLQGLVKLKPGVSVARAQADLGGVARGMAQAYPESGTEGIKVWELWRAPASGGGVSTAVIGIQLGVALLVLLIVCANVANLLLAGAAMRQRETAVRLTLGASRGRLVQQLLTESTLLAVAGGVAGTVTAYWTKDLIRSFVPPTPLPIDLAPRLGVTELVFAFLITGLTAMIFGLVPALEGSASAVMSALKESATAVTATPRRARIRTALVIAQVALSLQLLVSASLFVRTLLNSQAVDPGFATRTGVLAAIDLQPGGYDAPRGNTLLRTLLARVREMPGVNGASFVQRVPLGFGGSADMSITVEGYTPAPNEEVNGYYTRAGSEYLHTMGIPIVAGRDITDNDAADKPAVVVINETMARRYFAGRDPIGGRIRAGNRTMEVVGVARDGKYVSITEQARAFMYLPAAQWYRPDTVLIVNSTLDPAVLVPMLQSSVRSLDANVPLFEIRTIAEHLQVATFVQRMIATILGAFGVLALVLATVGLYGLIAGIVAQRTAEIGMRMALGAATRDIMALIVRQGLKMTLVGVAVGLLLALASAPLFRTLLVGIGAFDAASFFGTSALLMLVSLAAVLIPARRAARLDPNAALRA